VKGEFVGKGIAGAQESLVIGGSRSNDIPKPLAQLSEDEIGRKQCISRVMTRTLGFFTKRLVGDGFEWLLPVIFSKSTDPLWPDRGASIEKRIEVEIYGRTVRTTLSMIVHKMVACSLACAKLFILSPNVRIERRERAKSGIHAYEFTQLDFEVRDATSEGVRSLVEQLICGLVGNIRSAARGELIRLGRFDSLRVPEKPFRVHDRRILEKRLGEDYEAQLALEISEPVWITNMPREFYDFEDFETGLWDNYDLLLPQYGEVLSGGRREWEYSKIARKMKRDNVVAENYEEFLKLAKEGRIRPSAGAGIGIERLVSWLVGAKHIGETQPFPKIPGIVFDL
jgi:asparaginyl-tRNA synthetase